MKGCILIIAMVLCSANARADPFCPFDCVGTGVEDGSWELAAHDGDLLEITHDEGGFILPVGAGETIAKEGQILVWVDPTEKTANRYFNLALSCIMLLDIELKIEDRRETWGVMADICRSRHNITKED